MRVAGGNYSLLAVGLPKRELARRVADDSQDHSTRVYHLYSIVREIRC